MKSTLVALSGLLIAGAMVGCTRNEYSQAGRLNDEPLVIDGAMQKRNWEPTPAYYANGDTVSWSTGFAYQPQANNQYQYYYADTGTYFVNLFTLPYTLYKERDGLVSQGVVLPPTYTAAPPLPPTNKSDTVVAPTTQPSK